MSIPLSKSVLVVEDNLVNQQVTMGLLRHRLSIEPDLAIDGLDAIAKAKIKRYDLILMDCQMPRCDGFAATRAIRRMETNDGLPNVPIVALTAQALAGDRDLCLAAGMNDYLTKPVDADRLIRVVEHYLAGTPRPVSEPVLPVVQATNDVPVLDPNVVETITACGADAVSEVYGVMLQDLVQRQHQIANALALGDTKSLSSVAHSLKGSSGTIGARQLEQVCRRMEHFGKSADIASAKNLWGEFAQKLAAARSAIDTVVSKHAPAG